LIEARQNIEKLEPQLSLLDAKLVQLRASLATRETQRNRNAELSQRRENLLRANAGLRESQTSVDAAMELYARAIDAKRVADAAEAARSDWAAKNSSAQQRKHSAAVAIAEMERTAATLRSRLEAEQNDADAVAKAVAEIAVRLKEADTTCPVCAHLHSPGELVRKARESMALMRAGSATLAEELAAVQSQLRTLHAAQETAVNDEAGAKQNWRRLIPPFGALSSCVSRLKLIQFSGAPHFRALRHRSRPNEQNFASAVKRSLASSPLCQRKKSWRPSRSTTRTR
jgi:chromosome segregation ATPase